MHTATGCGPAGAPCRARERHGPGLLLGGVGAGETQGYEQFVGAAEPGQVGGGGGFAQLDLAVATEAGAQQCPVRGMVQIKREAQVALAQHDGRRGA